MIIIYYDKGGANCRRKYYIRNSQTASPPIWVGWFHYCEIQQNDDPKGHFVFQIHVEKNNVFWDQDEY